MPPLEAWPEAKAKAIQLPRRCKASSSSQPASAGVIRSTAPVIRLTEDPPIPPKKKKLTEDQTQLQLALDETAKEEAQTKKVLVKEIEKKLGNRMLDEVKHRLDRKVNYMRVKEEEVEDADTRRVQLKRVLEIDRDFSTMRIPEMEEKLNAFKSYKRIGENGKVDKDHLYWLTDDLALYALQTDQNLRAVFLDSYVEMENEIDKSGEQEYLVKIFSMDEFDFRGDAHDALGGSSG